jgi:hypothetical protein
MSRNFQLPRVNNTITVPVDTESGAFQWSLLLGVASVLVAVIRFLWTLSS